MRRILPVVLLCLLALAPTSCKKAKLRAQLKELMGSTIVLPEKVSCVYNGEVYPMPDSLRDKAMLIIYIDSAECTTCRISHIEMYHALFELSRTDGSFDVFILLSNLELNGIPLLKYLSDIVVDHPLYVDEDNVFLKLNPVVPDDRRMRAFLVNGQGRPICIGDPVSSDRMHDVFLDALNKL